MYRVLRGEMVKSSLSIARVAFSLGVTEKTLRNKINGSTEFTWSEICKIHKLVNPQMTKENLFQKDENPIKTNICS